MSVRHAAMLRKASEVLEEKKGRGRDCSRGMMMKEDAVAVLAATKRYYSQVARKT